MHMVLYKSSMVQCKEYLHESRSNPYIVPFSGQSALLVKTSHCTIFSSMEPLVNKYRPCIVLFCITLHFSGTVDGTMQGIPVCFLSQTLFPSELCWKTVYILIFGIDFFPIFQRVPPMIWGIFNFLEKKMKNTPNHRGTLCKFFYSKNQNVQTFLA